MSRLTSVLLVTISKLFLSLALALELKPVKEYSYQDGIPFRKPTSLCKMGDELLVTDTGGAVFVLKDDDWDFFVFENVFPAQPLGIACFPSRKTLCISDGYTRRVFCYDEKGKLLITLGPKQGLKRPTGLAADDERGVLAVVDTAGHRVFLFDLTGKLLKSVGRRGEQAGEFNYPTNATFSKDGRFLVVSDTLNFRVQVLTRDGGYVLSFGGPGDAPGFFGRPRGVAVDGGGRIFVADGAFSVVHVFTPGGKFLTYAGVPGTEKGELLLPMGVFIENDLLFVADQMNRKVVIFKIQR
ncbi:MAG: hypothetical protein GXO03_02565 [Aquificae bacterium]|nr:hypothetical protein [Aquificota bacterium]